MGPHSFKCGKPYQAFPNPNWVYKLQWGRTLSSAESRMRARCPLTWHQSFNGAALFQVRKANSVHPLSKNQNCASMGPHSFKCGKLQARFRLRMLAWSFNGAALFQVRKARQKSGIPKSQSRASMGPHSFKCGKLAVHKSIVSNEGKASMGPHSFKCGKRKI